MINHKAYINGNWMRGHEWSHEQEMHFFLVVYSTLLFFSLKESVAKSGWRL